MTKLVRHWCAWLLLLLSVTGCEYVRPTLNAPLTQWEPAGGYRFSNLAPPEADNTDGLFIMASFSGGGTRASTLAFGVLRELARQQITWEGKQKRLLDELDAMFALSGGTFTAAYYALYGDQIFHDFESPLFTQGLGSGTQIEDLAVAQQLDSAVVSLFRPRAYHGRTAGRSAV